MKKVSIIICSKKGSINQSLFKNIKKTIGCEYELIVINNSENKYSIFEAYNIGLSKSTTPFVVFSHEDILFHTSNWGILLQKCFEDHPDFGLIGVAGSKILTKMPSPWWSMNENVWNIIQHFKNKSREVWNQGFDEKTFTEVAVIDGVFMAMRNNNRIHFDERLEGFHNYDLNLSIEHHLLQKKVVVTNVILLEHFSEGSLNRSWYKSSGKFRRLYQKHLPIKVSSSSINDQFLKTKEFELGYQYLQNLIDQKLYKELIYWWWKLFQIKKYSKFHMRLFKKIVQR